MRPGRSHRAARGNPAGRAPRRARARGRALRALEPRRGGGDEAAAAGGVAWGRRPTDVAFSPDGRRLLVTGVYGLARICDTRTRRPRSALAAGTSANPGPEAFYAARSAPTARRWPSPGRSTCGCGTPRPAPSAGIACRDTRACCGSVSYSPDYRRIVTSSANGSARVWNAANGSALAVLTRHAGRSTTLSCRTGGSSRAARTRPSAPTRARAAGPSASCWTAPRARSRVTWPVKNNGTESGDKH